MDELERRMREALFGPVAEKVIRRKQHAFSAGYIVLMSVRQGYSGPPFRVEIPVATISHLEAWTEAHKRVKEKGLIAWCVIDIYKVENIHE